jgi:NIPSNAP
MSDRHYAAAARGLVLGVDLHGHRTREGLVTYQLRDYRVAEGRLEDWVREWKDNVLPLRLAFGFELVGAWIIEEENRFVWIIGHADDFAAADSRYYGSDERKALSPDPARHLVSQTTALMRPALNDTSF